MPRKKTGRPAGNPNWKKGQGGGPKSSKLVVAVRDDPDTVKLLVGGYLQYRKTGRGVKRAENAVLKEVLDVTSLTIQRWRTDAAAGKEPYASVFGAIREAEENMRQGLFDELDPELKKQPYRYLEKFFVDWREDQLNTEAVEAKAQEIAGEKLTLLASKVEELEKANPEMSAAELVTAAVEHLAEVK